MNCIFGTFEAEAWHVGRYVVARPSGWLWDICDEEVDIALSVLQRIGNHATFQSQLRTLVTMSNLDDRVVIRMKDTMITNSDGCYVVLSRQGRREFMEVLRHAASEELMRDLETRLRNELD